MPRLFFFTDPIRTPDPGSVIARLPRGAAVVFRAFGATDACAVGLRLRRVARSRGVLFFVGADAALAVALDADGLHWPERLAARCGMNRALRPRFLITAAAHSLPGAIRGRCAGADALVISPVFPSRSPSAGLAMGPLRFSRLVRMAGAPVIALGGVTSANAGRLRLAGAAGLAAIDGLL